jgi:hypothetical protein
LNLYGVLKAKGNKINLNCVLVKAKIGTTKIYSLKVVKSICFLVLKAKLNNPVS